MVLDYRGLVGNSLVQHTKDTLSDSETLSYYIDSTIGSYELTRYPVISYGVIESGKIQIYTIDHSERKKEFIRDTFKKLDKIIDLDFEEMNHNNGSMLDIYHINYSSSFEKNIVGQAISQRSSAGSWWDILWKDSNLSGDINQKFDKNTIVHEIGHCLGLRHPFDEPQNVLWNSDDTVMSYNRGEEGWSGAFTSTDLNALISIWGREDDLGIIQFEKNSFDYKFKRSGNNSYFIKTDIGLEDITNINTLQFSDKKLDL